MEVSLSKSAPLKWLLLDFNSYFASCEQHFNPALRGKPIAVVAMMSDTTSVLAASYPAKAFGIRTGTLVGDAKRLCPGLVLIEADHKKYVEIHERMLEAIDSCLPVEQVLSIDEVLCELKGSQTTEEGARALALKIKRTITENIGPSMTCSIGIATNWFLAKLGSDMMKPDGLVVYRKEDLPQALFKCKIRDLYGIGAKTEASLNKKGIYSIERMARLSASDMRQLWGGVIGERYYAWIRGEEVFEPKGRTKSIGHQHVLPPDERTHNRGLKVLMRLLDKAAVRMRKDDYYAKRMDVNIKFWTKGVPSISDGWADPEGADYFEGHTVFDETQETPAFIAALEKIYRTVPKDRIPIRVSVTLSGLVPGAYHQTGLFADRRHEGLSKVMDSINERFGKHAVYYGALDGTLKSAPVRISFNRVPNQDEF